MDRKVAENKQKKFRSQEHTQKIHTETHRKNIGKHTVTYRKHTANIQTDRQIGRQKDRKTES
jgi:hypothetical protein